MKRELVLGAAITSCAWMGTALAQDAASTGKARTGAYELGAIVVSGRPIDAVAGQTLISVTSDQIEARGSRTVDQALDTTPGINIRTGGNGVPRIFLRGLPPRHTPIFLNGVPLNSAVDGQFDPSLIPTGNIARIDVVEGNSSVLYGPGTTGGVVDIITKKGAPGLHGGLRFETGSGNTYLLDGDISGADRAGNFFLSGRHASTTGYLLPDRTTRLNSDRELNNLFLNLGTDRGDWSIGVTGSLFDGSQGIPPSTISSSASDPFAQRQQFERLDDISGASGQLDLKYAPGGPFGARFSAYVSRLHEIDDRFDDGNFNSMTDPTVKTFHQVINSLVEGGQSRLTYDFDAMGALSSAFGVRHEGERLGGSIRDVPQSSGGGGGGGGGRRGGGTKTFGVRLLDSDLALNTYWAAMQYNVSPTDKLHVTLGIGENWFDDGSSTRSDSQAMAGLDYDPLLTLRLNLSYSHKVRYPTLQELFDAQKGNPDLLPEQSDDFAAGFGWSPRPHTLIRFTAFVNYVANFIQNDDALQIFTNKNTRVRGFELVPQAQLRADLYVRGGYTYLETIDESTGLPVDFRPRHILHVEVAYRPFEHWAINGRASYFADQVVTSKDNPVLQRHMPDYLVADLRISRLFPEWNARLYAEADNLFNTSYSFAPGLPAPGLMLLAGAQIGF